jgi:ABC-type molybdenum transport system ATPase subunit/photorepair protein PhrA
MLILKNYKKTYNESLILKAESLQIPEGLIWIKGPNGSGNDSALRIKLSLYVFL